MFCFTLMQDVRANRNGVFKAVSLIGGGKSDPFLYEGGENFEDAMNGLNVNGEIFFGGPDRRADGKICTTSPRLTIPVKGKQVSVKNLKKEVFNGCKGMNEIFDIFTGRDFTRIKDCKVNILLNGRKKPRGEALKRGLSALKEAETLKSGDTFFLNISGHGSKRADGTWVVQMSDGSHLNSAELKNKMKVLSLSGVNVQLHVASCFSGGFSKMVLDLQDELKLSKTKGMICSTAMQDADNFAYGRDALLDAGYDQAFFPAMKKYGNQLSASACASGKDIVNRPTSSLSEYLKRWHRQDGSKVLAKEVTYGSELNAFIGSELNDLISNLNDVHLKVQQEALIEDMKKYWIEPLQQCWKENTEDMAFMKKAQSCLKTSPPTSPTHSWIVPHIKSFLAGKMGPTVDSEEILLFTKFIGNKKLEQKDLDDFKTSFCCLARDIKTGSLPESCL